MAISWERAARSIDTLFSLYNVYLSIKLFPVLVLRAGFGFRLPQFLFIAYVLLLCICVATFWEIDAHLVYNMFSLYHLYL